MYTRPIPTHDDLRELVAENAEVALIVIDANHRVCWSNARTADLLGYSGSELDSADFWSLFDIGTSESRIEAHSAIPILSARRPFTERRTGQARRKDQTHLSVELALTPIVHAGEPMSLVTIHEVAKQRQLEWDNAALHGQLCSLNRMETAQFLTGSILHDFNNVLQAILGNAQQVIESAIDRNGQEALAAIIQATHRGSTLIRRLRGTGNQSSLSEATPRPSVDFVTVVHEALCLLRGALPCGIRLEWSLSPDTPTVSATEIDLHQVVMNLGINAAEAMRAHGGLLRVTLEPEMMLAECAGALAGAAHGQYAKLSVCDSGEGMDAATLGRAFEPFFSTKPREQASGLGLAVVRRIVERLGGSISVQSEPGNGSAFCVRLPASSG